MILENIDFLNKFNGVSVFVRLILALILGALLGIERERKQRPAGLRTYTLVCLGSALAAVTNEYICTIYPSADPARIPAQIVSGIGFLGAGTILVTKEHQVKGLTTAAGQQLEFRLVRVFIMVQYLPGFLLSLVSEFFLLLIRIFLNTINI